MPPMPGMPPPIPIGFMGVPLPAVVCASCVVPKPALRATPSETLPERSEPPPYGVLS